MSDRHSFYLPPEEWIPPFRLYGPEAHHLSRVLRISVGRTVRLFDGCGRQGLFSVVSVTKSAVDLTLLKEERIALPPVRCTLAAGFSKALRRGWFLEKAVELEASALWFWQGEYSQAKLPAADKQAWQGSLIAGAKQCGNPWLPSLTMIQGGVRGIAEKAGDFDRAYMLYEGETDGRLLDKADLAEPGNILLLVGPEGGFSLQEVECCTHAGILPVSLGKRILRWETAAVLTLGMAWWARQH